MPTRKPSITALAKLAPPAPEEPLNERLVEEATDFIRTTLSETVYQGTVKVGDYLLHHFFHDDLNLVRSHSSTKNASFRSLAERCGTAQLPVSKSWLHNAVGIAAMQRLLPTGEGAYKQLPPSHQVSLLPLRDPTKVERLAERALSKELSVRDLKEEVAREVAKAVPKGGEKRGRPPVPVIVKTLNRSLKLFTLEGGKRSFTKAMVDELDQDEAKRAIKAAEGLIERLEGLVVKLREKV